MRKLIGALAAGLCMLCFQASAQENWGGGVDDEVLHFGFSFQYINAEYKVLKKADWRTPFYDPSRPLNVRPNQLPAEERVLDDSLYSVSSEGKPGFGIGFVSDLRLGNHLNLRLTPTLVFSDRSMNYEYPTDGRTIVNKKVEATVIEMPLAFKLKSDRRQNFRAYLLAGGKYSMNIVSKKKLDDESATDFNKFLKNKKSYFSYEAGIGFDLYFEYFKMSPEIKFSQSLGDVLYRRNEPYSTPIDKLFLRSIQFSLFFE